MRKYQPSQTGEKRTRRTQREKVSSSTENRRANESQRGIDVCIYCIEREGRVGGGGNLYVNNMRQKNFRRAP